jgi:hypothetical protein
LRNFFYPLLGEKMEMMEGLPLSKVPSQGWDARFTVVGLIERCSLPLASGSSFCTILTVSDGWSFVVVCISLPGWEGHPKCVRRSDILVLRCCRRSKGTNDWVVLKGVAAQWILVCGEMGESQEDPKCLTDAEALVVKQLRLLVGSGVLGFTFSTRFYPQAFMPVALKKARQASLVFLPPLYKHLEELFRPGHEECLSFDAVQVTLFWPFHETSWCAVLWDGYGCGFWAAVLDTRVACILHDAITFCNQRLDQDQECNFAGAHHGWTARVAPFGRAGHFSQASRRGFDAFGAQGSLWAMPRSCSSSACACRVAELHLALLRVRLYQFLAKGVLLLLRQTV